MVAVALLLLVDVLLIAVRQVLCGFLQSIGTSKLKSSQWRLRFDVCLRLARKYRILYVWACAKTQRKARFLVLGRFLQKKSYRIAVINPMLSQSTTSY